MNTAQRRTTPVVVTLTNCSKEDANAVFQALRQSYNCDRADDEAPEYTAYPHTVWTSTFEVAPERAPVGPVQLSAAVEAGLQGGYWAVDRMLETLAAEFDIQRQSTAAGDQEKDVQLRLMSATR